MILRALASITVVAGLAGVLWSAPAQPVEPAVLVSANPAPAEREMGVEERIERRVDEFIERAKEMIGRLHEEGRHGEAEALEEDVRDRVEAIREVAGEFFELREEAGRLREMGEIDEAQEAQREAREVMGELRGLLAPRGNEAPRGPGPREHMDRLREKIAHLRAEGRMEEARRLQREARELAARWRDGDRPPPRRPRPVDELREMRMHLQNLHREMDELHEHGHHEEAEALARKAEDLEMEIRHREGAREGEAHELIQMREKLGQLHQEIQALHERGRHEEAEELEQHAQAIMMELREREGHPPHPEAELEEMERRIAHMFQAAENLQAAGMHEEAERLFEHAEMMEQRLHDHMEGARPHPEQQFDVIMGEIHELRAEVHELSELVRDLHRRLDRMQDWD